MEDDTYQRMADYENEIYDLNHDIDQDSEQQESNQNSENEDMTDDEGQETSNRSIRDQEEKPNGIKDLPNGLEQSDTDFSEDEREMILSRLYHSSNAFPTISSITDATHPPSPEKGKSRKTKASGKKKKTKSATSTQQQDVPPIPSKEFTFEIDLDNLPPPPDLTIPTTEAVTLDEDGDFGVYPLTPKTNIP